MSKTKELRQRARMIAEEIEGHRGTLTRLTVHPFDPAESMTTMTEVKVVETMIKEAGLDLSRVVLELFNEEAK